MKAFVHHGKQDQAVIVLPGEREFIAAEVRIGVGAWVVFAKADVMNWSAQPAVVECTLDSEGFVRVPDKVTVNVGTLERATINLSLGIETQGLPLIRLKCAPGENNTMNISNITISAIQVDFVTVTVAGHEGAAEGSSQPLVGFSPAPPLFVSLGGGSPVGGGFQEAPPLYVQSGEKNG